MAAYNGPCSRGITLIGERISEGIVAILLCLLWGTSVVAQERAAPLIIGHRGLLRHAPENTMPGFSACLNLRLGFELDVRRTSDGALVVLHDPTLNRTTNGKGKVADISLADLRKLDAGGWFEPSFSGVPVPKLDDILALIKEHPGTRPLVALDLKMDDSTFAEDLARTVRKHGVTDRVVCIGLAIEDADLRKRLRQADRELPIAVLAKTVEDFAAALEDASANWVYIRFIPTNEQVEQAHKAGKKVFLLGPLVMPHEPENWNKARAAGVDALLTDYPLECRAVFRGKKP